MTPTHLRCYAERATPLAGAVDAAMPALVTCRGTSLENQWNVGSDDFVLAAIVIVALSLLRSEAAYVYNNRCG